MKNLALFIAVLLTIVIYSTASAAPCPCAGGRCPAPSLSCSFDTSMPMALPTKISERPYAPPVAKPVVAQPVFMHVEPAASEVKREGPRRPIVRAVAKTPKAVAKGVCGLAKIRPLKGLGRLLAHKR